MPLPDGWRRLALTAHVTASVGWLGAVAAVLALALTALTADHPPTARACDAAMGLVTRLVIVPLSLATLLTGLLQSLGTVWGLFRHYWVVAKLLLTVVATALLFLHTGPIERLARDAAAPALATGEVRRLRTQLAVDAGAGLAVLLVTTALSVFRPRGVTPYGWRKQRAQRAA